MLLLGASIKDDKGLDKFYSKEELLNSRTK